MNECACNSMSPHNGKDSLLYRLCLDSSQGESMVLVIQWIYCGWQENHSFIWLFLASVVWLMIMADRSTYLCANRAITFTEEDPLTLESDWYHWIELTQYIQLHYLYAPLGPDYTNYVEFHWSKTEVMKPVLKLMIDESFTSSSENALNIHWFQILKCEDLLFISVLYHYKNFLNLACQLNKTSNSKVSPLTFWTFLGDKMISWALF